MKPIYLFIALFASIFLVSCTKHVNYGKGEVRIVPKPVELTAGTETFELNSDIKIYGTAEFKNEVEYLSGLLHSVLGYKLRIADELPSKNAIVFELLKDDKQLGAEGYKLSVGVNFVKISANTPAGIFYGIQSFTQLFPPKIFSKFEELELRSATLPTCEVVDYPRFAYRGMHLDVSRHFFSKEFVMKYIDYLAAHKLNKFHWHLTDDQGWRIEIKKYPKLTEIGSVRNETMIGKNFNEFDKTKHSGFYTQEEIKEVVAYAAQRHIAVIPEIEMPGHALAALAAYPNYSCTGGPFEVHTKWGVTDDIFCAGKEETFGFLQDVLTEVMTLFPSNYIHIGGDEAPKERWNNCNACKTRMKTEKLKDAHELQSYFVKRMEKFLNEKGRKLIGWDEILEGGLAPAATVMSWRGMQGGIDAAMQNHDVIMTPGTHMYFDHYQGDAELEPLAIGGFTSLNKVYSFEPVPSELPDDKKQYIIGAQANLWTEYIATEAQVEYMILPRMSAMAEVNWTMPENKNYDDFIVRMQPMFKRWFYQNANFRLPEPQNQNITLMKDGEKFEFKSAIDFATVFYTTDGEDPDTESAKYTEPILLERNSTLKAITMLPGGLKSAIKEYSVLLESRVKRNKIYGLNYRYFPGDFSQKMPDFRTMKPASEGHVIYPEVDNFPAPDKKFGMHFTGLIFLPIDEKYVFGLKSDDGGKLFIDDKLIVGSEGFTALVTDTLEMLSGFHKVDIFYTEFGGSRNLKLQMETKGIKKQNIQPGMFFIEKKEE